MNDVIRKCRLLLLIALCIIGCADESILTVPANSITNVKPDWLLAAEAQENLQRTSEPTDLYLRNLRSALSSGAAHIAADDGMAPLDGPPQALG